MRRSSSSAPASPRSPARPAPANPSWSMPCCSIAGGRGAGDVVRHGAERAEVAAGFSALSEGALRWLEAQAIEHDGEVIVRRVIGADGRSRAYVNGQLVPMQALREFAEFLIEIHGQQEFQHLVKRSAQRELLDEHLRDAALTASVAPIYERYRAAAAITRRSNRPRENREARLDLLRYQLTRAQGRSHDGRGDRRAVRRAKAHCGRGRLAAAARTALAAVYEDDGASAHDLAGEGVRRRCAARRTPIRSSLQPAQLLAEASIIAREAAEVSAALSRRARHGPGAPRADRTPRRGARGAGAQAPPERARSAGADGAHRAGNPRARECAS